MSIATEVKVKNGTKVSCPDGEGSVLADLGDGLSIKLTAGPLAQYDKSECSLVSDKVAQESEGEKENA